MASLQLRQVSGPVNWGLQPCGSVGLLPLAHTIKGELRSEPQRYRFMRFNAVPRAVIKQLQDSRFHIETATSKSLGGFKLMPLSTCSSNHTGHNAAIIFLVRVDQDGLPIVLQSKTVEQNWPPIVVDHLDYNLWKDHLCVDALVNRKAWLSFTQNCVSLALRFPSCPTGKNCGEEGDGCSTYGDPLVKFQIILHGRVFALAAAQSRLSISQLTGSSNGRM